MPEGDTIHQAATRLASVLEGNTVETVSGSHRAVREFGTRLRSHAVESVRAVGKQLLVGFDHGWSLRTHLGMSGVWHVYQNDEPWRKTPGKARVVLATRVHSAVCFSAPTVQIAPTPHVMEAIDHLGVDLLAELDEAAEAQIREAAQRSQAESTADLIVDQTVMAGLGNVYKSEVLFLEHMHPDHAPVTLSADEIDRLARRGRRLLLANLRAGTRTTTGSRRQGDETWVYGRQGQPCRRCGTTIESGRHGPLDRITYWCPVCQQ